MGIADYLRQVDAGDWLTPALEAEAEKRVQPEGWYEPETFVSPSSSHSVCSFEAQLSMLGYRTGFNARSTERVLNGAAAHERITQHVRDAGLLHAAESRLTVFADDWATDEPLRGPDHRWLPQVAELVVQHGPIRWSGEVDLIVRRPGVGTLHIGDIKTVQRFGFAKIPAQETDLVAMGRRMMTLSHYIGGYVRQLFQYEAWFRECAGELGYAVSPEVFLLFENTDTQEWTIRWMKSDPALLAESFRPGQEAVAATREGRLIEPPFPARSETCNDCFSQRECTILRKKEGPEWSKALTNLVSTQARLLA